jgi:hypothetical protein
VSLTLPRFSASPWDSDIAVDSNGVGAQAAWANNTLVLTFEHELPAGTPVLFVVPESAGLVLPADGVALDDASVTLSSDAADGKVIPTPVFSTQAVGTFMFTGRLIFNATSDSSSSNLSLSFVPQMRIAPGETIVLRMIGFQIDNTSVTFEAAGSRLVSQAT